MKLYITLAITLLGTSLASAADWPVWGRNGNRNLYSPEKGLPASFDRGKFKRGTEEIDMGTTKNVRWAAKLCSQA